MNRYFALLGLSAVAAAAFSATEAMAAVPKLNDVGSIPYYTCPVVTGRARIFYVDGVVLQISGPLTAADPADQADLDAVPRDTELTIKLRVNPTTVGVLENRVLSFLGAAQDEANRTNINVLDVDVTSTVCENNTAP